MTAEELEIKLNALEKELSKTRWIAARSRLAQARASTAAKRQPLAPSLLQAEQGAAKALSASSRAYCHTSASQALDELEACLDRQGFWG